ncbi:hypothetical protein J6590_014677 [Homalodisca vitripennis]|nr:hypothetical protein J6590_014677 [Homalodisca vitripennis]
MERGLVSKMVLYSLSPRGKPLLTHEGHKYHLNKTAPNGTKYWCCCNKKYYKCHGTLAINRDNMVWDTTTICTTASRGLVLTLDAWQYYHNKISAQVNIVMFVFRNVGEVGHYDYMHDSQSRFGVDGRRLAILPQQDRSEWHTLLQLYIQAAAHAQVSGDTCGRER